MSAQDISHDWVTRASRVWAIAGGVEKRSRAGALPANPGGFNSHTARQARRLPYNGFES
jgi:hypothetical protein